MPRLWNFRHYVTPRGVDEIKAWYDAQGKKSQGKINSRLHFLSQNPQNAWPEKYFKMLTGPCSPLGEARLLLDKVQHRPLTFFSEGMTMTFVICAIEKGGRFEPKNACDIGKARKAEIEADASRSKPSDIPSQ